MARFRVFGAIPTAFDPTLSGIEELPTVWYTEIALKSSGMSVMRSIEVDTDVFARIWAHRMAGEETENEILRRLLGTPSKVRASRDEDRSSDHRATVVSFLGVSSQETGPVRWRDDVKRALTELGGTAALADIYARVRSIRRAAGRSLPPTTDDIIRRELENNSSDSHSYTRKRDWFAIAEGKGAGIWSIRGSQN